MKKIILIECEDECYLVDVRLISINKVSDILYLKVDDGSGKIESLKFNLKNIKSIRTNKRFVSPNNQMQLIISFLQSIISDDTFDV